MSKYLSTEPLSEGTSNQPKKNFPDIIYTKTNEKGYEIVTYPICSRNTDIKFKGTLLKDKDLWFGKLLDDPIIIKSYEYPAFSRYTGSESDFINPNNYGVRVVTSIDDIDVISELGIEKLLPEQCDYTKTKESTKEEIKAAKVKKKTTVVIPVLMNIYDEDEASLKIAFFSQELSYFTMKELANKKIISSSSESSLYDYLFGEVTTSKAGNNIVLFQNTQAPIRQQGTGNWNWTACAYTSLFDSLNEKTKTRYFNLEEKTLSRKYLQYFAAVNCSSLMTDAGRIKTTLGVADNQTVRAGIVMNEDNSIDEEKSTLNGLFQRHLRNKVWEHNPFRKRQETEPTVVNTDPDFDDIPF
jgi:hypothetical protein